MFWGGDELNIHNLLHIRETTVMIMSSKRGQTLPAADNWGAAKISEQDFLTCHGEKGHDGVSVVVRRIPHDLMLLGIVVAKASS